MVRPPQVAWLRKNGKKCRGRDCCFVIRAAAELPDLRSRRQDFRKSWEGVPQPVQASVMAPSPARSPDGHGQQTAVDKVIDLLRQAEARPLCVADLVQASGMSERTLRSCFRRCFGVAPHRYLHIRRMHLIRTALTIAAGGQDTVSAVAKRFGYADAGRMASAYLDMFGEYPQQTLERRLGK